MTPGGKLQPGDRIRSHGYQRYGPDPDNYAAGTVTRRTGGDYYAIEVRWDGRENERPTLVVDVPYLLDQGYLRLEPPAEPEPEPEPTRPRSAVRAHIDAQRQAQREASR